MPKEISIQIVKKTLNKAKLNYEDYFHTMLFLNSQLNKNGTSIAEKLFSHKLRTILPLLIPFTQSVTTEKHAVTQNVICKLPEMTAEKTVWIRRDEQNFWNGLPKPKINFSEKLLASQNDIKRSSKQEKYLHWKSELFLKYYEHFKKRLKLSKQLLWKNVRYEDMKIQHIYSKS